LQNALLHDLYAFLHTSSAQVSKCPLERDVLWTNVAEKNATHIISKMCFSYTFHGFVVNYRKWVLCRHFALAGVSTLWSS